MKGRHRSAVSAVVLTAGALLVPLASCSEEVKSHPKVIVLGFDGMDPRLCERLMDAGELPNLDRLRQGGGYHPLGTSVPPQSPVAWASFITGANPGVHGIFDFIHRDPSRQYAPYYAAAETVEGSESWDVGEHDIPLTFWPFNHQPTQTFLRRGGKPFWDYLDAAGVPTWIYDIPANYPPSPSQHGHMHCLAGMGVPDLLGGYGTYQYFDEELLIPDKEDGGRHMPAIFIGDVCKAKLIGPENTAQKKPTKSEVPFRIFRHPTESTARIELQGQTVVLSEGEWSDWQQIDFELGMPAFLPNTHVSGILRFYLQQVHPRFRLYVTPINIDPSDPGDQRLTEPPEFIVELADELGLFYTAGFQEDHKALSNEVFNDAEYQRQASYVLEERLNLRDYALNHYRDGLLFFYFSSTDLQAHMFWWDGDEKHPKRTPEEAKKYHQAIVELYRQMDGVIGEMVDRFGDEATILIMSDHGFANFRRQFNLNTWLRDEGYIQPSTCRSLLVGKVKWSQTRAYGLGLNGLYLNLQGRERDGIVDPKKRDALIEEITAKLLAVRDPASGEPVVAKVYRTDKTYSGPYVETAPDMIVGYHRGFRASWATALGGITDDVLSDNNSAWSADHCIAADQVPGVIFSNRRILKRHPTLEDMAPTILEAFNVALPTSIEGTSLFRAGVTADAKKAGEE